MKTQEVTKNEVVRVKVRDLDPNPYRRLDIFPVKDVNVEALMEKIRANGFNDSITARRKGDRFQLIGGHHRVEALKRMPEFGMDYEFNLTIEPKDDDEEMIPGMWGENSVGRSDTIEVQDEIVLVARDYLRNNPDVAAKHGNIKIKNKSSGPGALIIGAKIISSFIKEKDQYEIIKKATDRLNLVEGGATTREILTDLPSVSHANAFGTELKRAKKDDVEFSEAEQKDIADEISKKGVSKNALKGFMHQKVLDKKYKKKDVKPDIQRKMKVDTFEMFLAELSRKARLLDDDLFKLNELRDQLDAGDRDRIFQGVEAVLGLVALQKKLTDFITWLKEGDAEEMVDTETGEITLIGDVKKTKTIEL